MSLINPNLAWILNSQPATGEDPSDIPVYPTAVVGVSNRTAYQLLQNDSDLDDRLTAVETAFSSGMVISWPAASAPTGWLICNGAAVSRTTYAALFAVIGSTWGSGDGSTTFNLPDARGRTIIGAGTGPGLTARTLATLLGEETHTPIIAEMAAHTHNYPVGGYDGGTELRGYSSNDVEYTSESTGGGTAFNVMQPSAVMNVIIKT